MSPERCHYILIHYRELWELAHWPVSSNWLQKVQRRRSHTPTRPLLALTLDLLTIEAAIADLDQREAAIVMMRRWTGLHVVEISKALHCSTSTVRAVLSRAEGLVADIACSPPDH